MNFYNKKTSTTRLIMILTIFIISPCIIKPTSHQHFIIQDQSNAIAELSSFDNPTYIGQQTTITHPGVYALNTPIDFNPTSSGQSFITIASNDVILDLNRKTIRLDATNTQPNIIGIFVQPNLRNIIIRNGTISSMTWDGIYVSDGCNLININNISINGSTDAGINIDGLKTGTGISNVTLNDIDIQQINGAASNAYGILLKYTFICNLIECMVTQLNTNSSNCYGIKIKNSDSAQIKSCIVSENNCGGTVNIGYQIINCTPCIIEDCLSANNTCTGSNPISTAYGFSLERSQNQLMNNCSAISNQCTYTACGIRLFQSESCIVNNCQSLSNTSSLLDAIGFIDDTGFGNEFNECIANNNNGKTNGFGFLLNAISSSAITDCDIRANLSTTGTAYGISLTTTVCTIANNTIVGHIGNGGYGIFDSANLATGNVYYGNYAIKNTINYSPGNPTIPVFAGPVSAIPGPLQNISL